MRVLFEVSPQNISDLNDSHLRILVAKLAEEEVKRLGFSPATVTYGGHQNAPDGGIDIRVELPEGSVGGFIPRNAIGFQIKAEDLPPAAIEQEMMPGGFLRPTIVDLAGRNGAYIIVSSKSSVSDSALANRKVKMRSVINFRLKSAAIHLDYYDQTRIATWVNQYPGLINWVRNQIGEPFTGWLPLTNWSNASSETAYYTDNKTCIVHTNRSGTSPETYGLIEGINKIRQILQRTKETIRLVGLSGVGKTRLLQALFENEVGYDPLNPSSVFYTDISFNPAPSPRELLRYFQQCNMSAIMIVDNCGSELHKQLTGQLESNESGRIKLITVEYDVRDDVPESTAVFKLEPASIELVERLLAKQYPTLPELVIKSVSEKSAGNWRIAIAIAKGLSSGGGDSIVALRDNNLFERIFWQSNSLDIELYRIAQAASLVYSFDGENPEVESSELSTIAALAGLSTNDVYKGLAELKRRDVLQSRHIWRAILPHPLAHFLANKAIEEIHFSRLNKLFVNTTNVRLRRSFTKRLGDLHNSESAKSLAKIWLKRDGWLGNPDSFDYHELVALKDITPLLPEEILKIISRFISSPERMNQRLNPAKELTAILLLLAYDGRFFVESAKQFVIVTEPIPKHFQNQLDVSRFCQLFRRDHSFTHSTVEARIEVLRWLAVSESQFRRSLLTRCLEKMLTSHGGTISGKNEFGSQVRDSGRLYNSREGYFDWYYHVLAFIQELASDITYFEEVRFLFASHLKVLATHSRMTLQIVNLCKFLAQNGPWPYGWHRIRQATEALERIGAVEESKAFKMLESSIRPNSIEARIKAYVLTDRILQDELFASEDSRRAHTAESVNSLSDRLKEMAVDLAGNATAFDNCLPTLLSTNIHHVRGFFFEMARAVLDKASVWDQMVATFLTLSPDKRKFGALSFYLSGIERENQQLSEQFLEVLLRAIRLDGEAFELLSNLSLTKERFKLILEGVRQATLTPKSFDQLGSIYFVPEYNSVQFRELMEAWLQRHNGIGTAITTMCHRIRASEVYVFEIDDQDYETGRMVLRSLDFSIECHNRTYANDIATHCLNRCDPVTNETVFRIVRDAIINNQASAEDYLELLEKISNVSPRLFLNSLIEGESAIDWRYRMKPLDDSQKNPVDSIPEAELIQWAEENPTERYGILAEMMTAWRPIESNDENQSERPLQWTQFANFVLQKAPEPSAILTTLLLRFTPTSWSSSKADVLATRLPLLSQLQSLNIPGVGEWASQQRPLFEAYIADERDSELERYRQLHERFEY